MVKRLKMRKFTISREFEISPAKSDRVTTLMRMFGVSIEQLRNERMTHKAEFEIEAKIPADERINIEQIQLPADKAAILVRRAHHR